MTATATDRLQQTSITPSLPLKTSVNSKMKLYCFVAVAVFVMALCSPAESHSKLIMYDCTQTFRFTVNIFMFIWTDEYIQKLTLEKNGWFLSEEAVAYIPVQYVHTFSLLFSLCFQWIPTDQMNAVLSLADWLDSVIIWSYCLTVKCINIRIKFISKNKNKNLHKFVSDWQHEYVMC